MPGPARPGSATGTSGRLTGARECAPCPAATRFSEAALRSHPACLWARQRSGSRMGRLACQSFPFATIAAGKRQAPGVSGRSSGPLAGSFPLARLRSCQRRGEAVPASEGREQEHARLRAARRPAQAVPDPVSPPGCKRGGRAQPLVQRTWAVRRSASFRLSSPAPAIGHMPRLRPLRWQAATAWIQRPTQPRAPRCGRRRATRPGHEACAFVKAAGSAAPRLGRCRVAWGGARTVRGEVAGEGRSSKPTQSRHSRGAGLQSNTRPAKGNGVTNHEVIRGGAAIRPAECRPDDLVGRRTRKRAHSRLSAAGCALRRTFRARRRCQRETPCATGPARRGRNLTPVASTVSDRSYSDRQRASGPRPAVVDASGFSAYPTRCEPFRSSLLPRRGSAALA